jgi:hypothetical protein
MREKKECESSLRGKPPFTIKQMMQLKLKGIAEQTNITIEM